MSFVKANVIYDCFESITFDDQNSPKLSDNGKAGIGFQRPENSKPSWLKNKLDKDKAKAGSKSFVPNQPKHNSRKAKSGWTKNQPRIDLNGQKMKSKLKRSHNYAQTFVDPHTGKTVKLIQVWVPKGHERILLVELAGNEFPAKKGGGETRNKTPSSACTRRTDEISMNGFSSSNWPETNFRRRRAAAAAAAM
ncbi:hypothetical protein F511_13858 [Dorcoceras hygrometricum]|uniref:Uncharacterized protein n=1 Tax=Dorcoceras hygrometricum TaxID=472368 RepID=A0A2Z7BZB3_9LAMI|nr:hypothetical protein F511_13858 [Dorcoceras hygrometricum]